MTEKKIKAVIMSLVAICIVFSGALSVSKADAAGAWGKKYKSLTPVYYDIYDAIDIDGSTVYASVKKKRGGDNFVLSLPSKHVEKRDSNYSYTLDSIAGYPVFDYGVGGFFYRGANYDEAMGYEEVNGKFVYRGYSDNNYTTRDLYLDSHMISSSTLTSYCSIDAEDLLRYRGQILGYNSNYFINCPNHQKTLIFSATGEYTGSVSGGGSALASQISCSGDTIVTSEPARETNGTHADAFYKYGSLRADHAKCSNGNLYFTSNDSGSLRIYKNGNLLSSNIYSTYYTILRGKAYWLRNDGNIQNEDGSITKKPKKYTVNKIFNYRNHIGMIAVRGSKKVILYKK